MTCIVNTELSTESILKLIFKVDHKWELCMSRYVREKSNDQCYWL